MVASGLPTIYAASAMRRGSQVRLGSGVVSPRQSATWTGRGIGPILILSVLVTSSPGFAATPEPHTVLRGHVHEVNVFTNPPSQLKP
jgi:hypothetical protein